jgi:peptide/nickel transport system permease protein
LIRSSAGLVVLVVLGFAAPVIGLPDPLAPDLNAQLQAPSLAHWAGTDSLGRDILSRSFHAIGVDLTLALAGVLIGAIIGAVLGSTAAFGGRVLGFALPRVAESVQAFPQVLFGMALIAIVGGGIPSLIAIIAVVNVPVYLMMVRAAAMPLKSADFAEAARGSGVSRGAIIVKYILPNAMIPVFSQFPLSCTYSIQLIAGLSFIGVGVEAPTPEWGSMIKDGATYLVSGQWWPSVVPGVMLVLTTIALIATSGGLRRALLQQGTLG